MEIQCIGYYCLKVIINKGCWKVEPDLTAVARIQFMK